MGLTLTVLGASGSFPGPGQAASGYLLQTPSTTVWLDAGSGTLSNLQRHVGLFDVDAVVLSHDHADHWTDLQGFSVACQWVLKRLGVPAYGPASIAKAAKRYMDPFDWHAVEDGASVSIGEMRLTFSRTDHGTETLAVRVEGDGRVLGYSADSGPGWTLSSLGPGLDVALCEATFLQDREDTLDHLSGRQAGQQARDAGAARLVVTHVLPTLDRADVAAEAAAAFGAPVEAAVTDLVVDV
jgi:ribonuclease BN (tRNA processing enzyme)